MAPLIGLPATVLITYLTYHDILHPILAVAVYGFFQLTDSFIFTPFIQGKMIGLHPITTIVVILVGSDLGGVFGLVLAIPTAAAVKILFNEFIRPVILDAADIHPESESRLSNDKKTDVASEGVSNG
jgi:predicted PurR-regulated permease PerM